MTFVRDLWYMAGWSEDLTTAPLARTIIGEDIVLFRGEGGKASALADMCPHRFAPLHLGKVAGGTIQCGYHGLRFDGEGACTANPHGHVPKVAHIRSYPVVERDTILWVWMGDQDRADPSQIADFHWLCDPNYTVTPGQTMTQPLACDLTIDNLLDLTHVQYLHEHTVGLPQDAEKETWVKREGNRIEYLLGFKRTTPPPLFNMLGATKPDDMIDSYLVMRWDPPGTIYMTGEINAAGAERGSGICLNSAQIVVPSTETSSYYFWKTFRNFSLGDSETTTNIVAGIRHAFLNEDEPMVAAVQAKMAGRDFWALRPLLLKTDSAAVQARRIMAELREGQLPKMTPSSGSDMMVGAELS